MPKRDLRTLEDELRRYALQFPEATEDHPWGHVAIKVRGKMFVILGGEEKHAKELSMSVKLPRSRDMAADLPFAAPTGYGMGKSGWVTARFTRVPDVPVQLLRAWIDESYEAIAPKKLSKVRAESLKEEQRG